MKRTDGMLKVGDRVVRQFEVGGDILRHGVITDVYRTLASSNVGSSAPRELYAVHWDDTGLTERGYLDVDLRPEPMSLGGLGV